MNRRIAAFLGLLFAAAFLICGKVFAEENINAGMASIEEAKVTEASLASLPEDEVPMDEELEDEEVVDTDA